MPLGMLHTHKHFFMSFTCIFFVEWLSKQELFTESKLVKAMEGSVAEVRKVLLT